MQYEETLEVLSIRMFPSMLKKMDQIMEKDVYEIFENKSHFTRCAVNHFMRSNKIKKILEE